MPITEAIAYLKYDDPTIETSRTITVPDSQFPAYLKYENGLTCYYLLDKGDSFEYVQNQHLLENAETVESLHLHAVANLAALASANLVVREYGDIFVATMGGNFEASLLLVDELWDETYSHVVDNGFVAAIPARDILAFCDSKSSEGIAQLVETIERVWPGGDHLLTKQLYRRVDRSWEANDT